MAKQLDQILVIDVESTCWEGMPPEGQINEIIEIGICPIDVATLERLEKRSILVKPAKSEISEYCTALTTLTPDMFTDSETFSQAAQILRRQYHSQRRIWTSWGDYDRRQFERNCWEYRVAYPFGLRHLNVKSLFALATGRSREIELDAAYNLLGKTLEGTHHRGDDDAWNIAGILCLLLQQMRTGVEYRLD